MIIKRYRICQNGIIDLTGIPLTRVCRDADVAELEAEVKRSQAEVGFWLGEGQEDRPEVVEYRRLVLQDTPAARVRVAELAEMFRMEHEDAPKLRQRIAKLNMERDELLGEVERWRDTFQCDDPADAVTTTAIEEVELGKRMREINQLKSDVKRLQGVVDDLAGALRPFITGDVITSSLSR